jgi:hypothetical protein
VPSAAKQARVEGKVLLYECRGRWRGVDLLKATVPAGAKQVSEAGLWHTLTPPRLHWGSGRDAGWGCPGAQR